MKLSTFIQREMEALLEEWENTAGTIAPNLKGADREALRDHARGMLEFVARDIERRQTAREQTAKSKGQGEAESSSEPTAAERHGSVRKAQGLSLDEMALEHRALRASVTRLWSIAQGGLETGDIDELVRFNEAMDQLLGDAIGGFSAQKEQQARLFETVLSFSPDPSGIFAPDGKLIYANRAMCDVLRTSPREAVGKDLFELGASFAGQIQDCLEHSVATGDLSKAEVIHVAPSGDELIFDCLLAPVRDKQGKIEAVAKTSRDITKRKANEYRIWRNANFDALTGIPNRRLFLDRLAQPLKESNRRDTGFALLFIDLDRFKETNDQLGHSAGDLLLKRVAERLSRCIREVDTLARLGGDEFTVILKDVAEPDKVEAIADTILAQLERPFRVQAHTVHISGSIGVTLFPRDGATADKLMRNADQAMYSAKQQGGHRHCFYKPAMEYTQSEHSNLARELQLALARDQFRVYYQPVIDLGSGALCQAEALLRWEHPQKGLLSPVTFLGVAEQMGLVDGINAFVRGQAIAHSREWSDAQGAPFPISINASPGSFFTRPLTAHWRSGFDPEALAGSSITVELSESSLASACANSADLIRSLGQNGIGLAIDDFGVGPFSIMALKECGVNCLKIDQAIVQNIQGTGESGILADGIICLAHSMGLKVVAEGVETDEQRRYLAEAGCDYAQGFLFSEPLPQEQFHALLQQSRH